MNEIDLEYEESIRDHFSNERWVPWIHLIWTRHLSEDFILEFIDKFGISHIFCYQKLSIEAIEKIIKNNNLEINDWENLSYYQKLPESFVDKYKDKLAWNLISCNRNFSLDFFRKFSYNLDWGNIGYYQKLSKKFVKEFSDKIYEKNIPWCFIDDANERGWKTFL
jgi:hypothetical protein